uniref:aspartate carbamoyltransferase n=1 Tax=viral metagenome TaxID=1070528 RepID=A0A6C0D1Z2_9ZZZZ
MTYTQNSKQNSLISVKDFTREKVMHYIKKAEKFEKYENNSKNLKTMINLFYEPSTRTSCSFHTAMLKMGGNIIEIADNSSAKKGESLEDTIKTVSNYGDVIVLRHPEKGAAERAANVATVPVINAGDGNGEHPTQALLDIYTIYKELNKDLEKDNITVTFMGDIKNSRTIHSLIHLLNLFDVTYIFISPPGLEIDTTGLNVLNATLEEALKITDVVYVTRIQKERIDGIFEPICLSKELLSSAYPDLIIMHPLPRQEELPPEIDDDPRAVYFKQVANGVTMRMAILDELL